MSKTALITGASRGIGKEIAFTLAQEGYHLHLICHTQKQLLEDIRTQLQEEYAIDVYTYVGDIGSPDFAEDVFRNISSIDVLINNAAISHIGLITDISIDTWHEVMNTNLNSVFYTSKLAVTKMLEHKAGKIINISSVWGNVGASMEVAYSTTKGGIHAFTKALAKELAPSKIQVNAIACGAIDTQMNAFLSDEEKQQLIDEIPACRLGTPKEVASFVLSILNSPTYLTGQVIVLDGGWQ